MGKIGQKALKNLTEKKLNKKVKRRSGFVRPSFLFFTLKFY